MFDIDMTRATAKGEELKQKMNRKLEKQMMRDQMLKDSFENQVLVLVSI